MMGKVDPGYFVPEAGPAPRTEEVEMEPLNTSGDSRKQETSPGETGETTAGRGDTQSNDSSRTAYTQTLGSYVLKLIFPRRLRLLLWKNLFLLALKRHYIVTFLQIGLPLIFTIIFALYNAQFSPNEANLSNITFSETIDETELIESLYKKTECFKCVVAYAPKTNFTKSLVLKLQTLYSRLLKLEDGQTLKAWNAFNSELEIEAYWHSSLRNENVELKAAILFQEGFKVGTTHMYAKDHNFSYTIRIPDLKDTADLIPDTYSATTSALQILMDKVLTEELSSVGYPEEKILLQAFPRLPAAITNSQIFGRYFNSLFPALLSLGFIFIVPSVVGPIVREKESGFRELMQVHGLSLFLNWLGWLLHSMVMLLTTTIIVLGLIFIPMNPVVGGIVKCGSISLWGTVLLVFCVTTTSWCILVSSFFYDPTFAISIGSLLWVGTYLLLAATSLHRLSIGWKLLFSMFPNLALTFCTELLLAFDEDVEGAYWSILFEPKDDTDPFTIGHAFIVMLLSCGLYNLFAWYFESVIPSKLGIPKPWNFIFKLSFWRNLRSPASEGIEGISGHVKICCLKKVIGGQEIFYCDSHTFRRGKITVLYGANGSGKTTLLLILAGLVPPTEGTAYVDGIDVTKDIASVRNALGYCPQSNMLLGDLTVMEHLQIFGTLKGVRPDDVPRHARFLLKRLYLRRKKDILAGSLSGGEKRKLNLGMAAMGIPKILLLDEPTSGVDLQSRYLIRQFIRKCAAGAIIMSSHFREDCLDGDVAVFRHGRLFSEMSDNEIESNSSDGLLPGIQNDMSWVPKQDPEIRLTGLALVFQQFRAMVWKRYLCTLRDKELLIIQVLLPVFLAAFTTVCANGIQEWYSVADFMTNTSFAAQTDPVTLYSIDNGARENWNSLRALSNWGGKEVQNVTEALIEVGEQNRQEYLDRYIAAAEFGASHVKAMFSITRINAVPISLNLASMAILRNKNGDKPQRIHTSINPLVPDWKPAVLDAADPSPTYVTRVAVVVGAVLPMGIAILAASFVVIPVKEKISKVKQLQLMTGLNGVTYWGASLFWDGLVTTIISGLMVLFFRFMGTSEFLTDTSGEVVLLGMLITYGFAAIFFSYFVSMMFSNVSKAFSSVATVHILSGIISFGAIISLRTLGLDHAAFMTGLFLRLFPTFGISVGVTVFSEILTLNNRCRLIPRTTLNLLCDPNNTFDQRYRSCCPRCQIDFPDATCYEAQPYLQWIMKPRTGHAYVYETGIGVELLYMFALGTLYMSALGVFECQTLRRIHRALPKVMKQVRLFSGFELGESDASGGNEEGALPRDGIEVKNLSKSYNSIEVVSAVDFQVPSHKCLSLVGPNGAGKSTLFRILTGDEIPSSGNVYIEGISLENDSWGFSLYSKERLSKIGYCPQYEGLIGALTGKEMLELFARLWGVRWSKTYRIALDWLNILGLRGHSSKPCRHCSGGMKRRLSVAIALIGDPPFVLLDEPTTGVDPEAHVRVANVIRNCGKSVIIATHDLKDCETISSDVAFLKNGRIVETGSVEYLKKKYQSHITIFRGNDDLGIDNLLLDCIARDLGGVLEAAWGNENLIWSCWIVQPRAAIGTACYTKLKEQLQAIFERYELMSYALKDHTVCPSDEITFVSIYLSRVDQNTILTRNGLQLPRMFASAIRHKSLEEQRNCMKQRFRDELKQKERENFKVAIASAVSRSFTERSTLVIKISNYLSTDLTHFQMNMLQDQKTSFPKNVSAGTTEWFEAEGDRYHCYRLMSARICKVLGLRLAVYFYSHVDGYICLHIAFTPDDVQPDDTLLTALHSSPSAVDTWDSGKSTSPVEGYVSSHRFLARASMSPDLNSVVAIDIVELLEVEDIVTIPASSAVDTKRESFKLEFESHVRNHRVRSESISRVVSKSHWITEEKFLSLKLTNYLRSTIVVHGRFCFSRCYSLESKLGPKEMTGHSARWFTFDRPGLNLLLSIAVTDDADLYIFVRPSPSGVMLLGGFFPVGGTKASLDQDEGDTETEDILRSLPFNPNLCHAGFEAFFRHGRLLARVYVSEDEKYALYVDVLEISTQEVTGSSLAPPKSNNRRLPPNEHRLNGSISCHYFLLHTILDVLYWPGRYAGIIDLDNRLAVSLKNENEVKLLSLHGESPQKQYPLTEVLSLSRETFYDTGHRFVQAMFSYEIESTDLSIVVAFLVDGCNNSFSVALLPSSQDVSTGSFSSMMDPGQWRIHAYRKYAYARDGEQVVKDGNIRVIVSMTEDNKSILTLRISAV